MARKIASILEGGDPTEKGTSKFEKQRQRAEKYTVEAEPTTPTLSTSNYRPLRPLQTNDSSYSNQSQQPYNTSDVPDCIKHSLNEAQFMNPIRYVGAPEEFKQVHMQVENLIINENEKIIFVCFVLSKGTCYSYNDCTTSSNEYRC